MPRHLVDAVEVTESQIHLIRLKGIFDASTVNEFEKVVSYLLTRNFFCMVVDLSAVEFISSAGWGAFTAELRRVRENNGDIKLAGMSADLFDVFLLLELDRFINAYETADEAIMAFLQPPPELIAAESMEVPASFGAPTAKEAIAIAAPAVYDTAAPALRPATNEDYRERYGRNNEVYVPEPLPAAVPAHGDDYWAPRQNFNSDDTLEIDREQRRLGSDRERRERLLTSGRATIEYANVPRILPLPAVATPAENQNHADAAASTTPPYDINDTGGEAESDFYEQEAALAEHDEPIAAAQAMDLFALSTLPAFAGPEPRAKKTYENRGSVKSPRQPERDVANPRPRKFSWQEAEAFSELSLDLESHLQAHGRYEEAEEDFNAFEELHDDTSSPSPARSDPHAETQQFNTIVFSSDEALAENSVEDDTNFIAPYTAMADLEPARAASPSVFSNDHADFNNDNADELMEAPRFNNYATTFQLRPKVTDQRMTPGHDDDFETQDIRDPWILEEIDTLPEEYEMDDAGAVYADRPIATEEFLAYDFENETAMPPASTWVSEDTPKYEDAPLTVAEENEVSAAPDGEMNGAAPDETSARPDLEMSDNLVDAAITNAAIDPADTADPAADEENINEVLVLPEARKLNLEAEALPAVTNGAETPKIPMSGDLVEMIRSIIAAYPHYGPTMICKFLEERVEPPVYLSRSTIYRYLREANLSTRQQRLEYAGEEFRLADEAAPGA